MRITWVLISILISSMGTTAGEKNLKTRKPNSESFTAHFGSIQVNSSKAETSGLFVRGDAAKAMYESMRTVKTTQVNSNNIIEQKSGTNVTCNHLMKSELGASNDGYQCILELNEAGGFVN